MAKKSPGQSTVRGVLAYEKKVVKDDMLTHLADVEGSGLSGTDREVEPFMIFSSLLCVCAQRQIRRLGKQCQQQYAPEGRVKGIMKKAIGGTGPFFKANPTGGSTCGRSGDQGRVGIHELMITSEKFVGAIDKRAETSELKHIAQLQGIKILHQDSMQKVKDGVSTFQEAIATVPPDRS